MRSLVFGDDGSMGASAAWGWITAQTWPEWRIDVVTVTHPERSTSQAQRELHEWQPPSPRRLPQECRCSALRFLTVAADPREALFSVPDSDVVVVGARGRGSLTWLHIGSTVHGMLRNPVTPVVIARTASPVRRILVCVDGSDNAERAASFAAGLPWIGGTHVVVMSVVDGTVDMHGAVARVQAMFLAAGATAESVLVEPNPLVLTVNVRESLFDAVATLAPDLIVMGTRGMSTFERISIGSIADAVAQHVECSVLLVR